MTIFQLQHVLIVDVRHACHFATISTNQFVFASLCANEKKKKETAENIQALFEWILAKHAQIIENVNQNDKNEEF